MNRNYLFLRIVLTWVFSGHVLTGVAALVSGREAIRLASSFYGASFEPAAQFQYIIRPLGAFILGLAFLQFMAIREPWRYKVVIDATLLVLFIRQFQRIVHAGEIYQIFGISATEHWIRTAIFLVTAVLLLVARLTMQPERANLDRTGDTD